MFIKFAILLMLIDYIFCRGRIIKSRFQDNDDFYQKCVDTIYNSCHQNTEFTDEELEKARLYIQKRFMSLAEFKPVKPPCKYLYVRRNFKCLTEEERLEVMDVFKTLYDNGIIGKMAAIHWKYWGEIHKFGEFIPWHRWFINEFEKQMILINPNVTLPYWSSFEEFDLPHLSMIWKYFGRAGDRFNDHCIKDSVLSNVSQCVRREWPKGIIPSWSPIELIDSVLQRATSLSDWFTLFNNPHFKIHLNIGGWSGQMSVTDAPYDAIFFPYHDWLNDLVFLKWQLQSDRNLIPKTYNDTVVFDSRYKRIRKANLERDRITFFNVSVVEVFQMGFGELCHIHDENIRAINQLINNERDDVPENYLKLPKYMAKKYFPKFYSDNYTTLDSVFSPIRNCNRKCRQISHPTDFVSTLNGRRLLRLYETLNGLDIAEHVRDIDFEHNEFVADLNSCGYCSPYIIS